ncbi:MAG: hypothetical protein ACOY4R_27830 [Pseudomonadota bacterium]
MPGYFRRGGDVAQDKAIVRKAMRQHEVAQHGGKHSPLKLRRGGKPKGYFLGGLFSGGSGNTTSTQTSSTTFDPQYQDTVRTILSRAKEVSEAPFQYFGDRGYQFRTGGDERFEPLTGDQQAAIENVRGNQGAWRPYMNKAGAAFDAAQGTDISGAAQPYITRAGQSPTGSAAASPYLTSASATLPGSIDEYMSPYTGAVVDRIAELGARNLSENLLPQVNDVFTGAQFGRTRHADFTARALRDTQESILGQQAQALESGYKTAGDQFQSDQARLASLAGTAGGLANQDIATQGALGQTAANIAGQQAANQIAAGQSQANLGLGVQGAGQSDANALLGAGALQQQQGQQQRDFDFSQWQNWANYPAQMVAFLNAAQSGLQIPSTTTSTGTTTGTAPSGSPFGQALGGLTSLASLAIPGASGVSALGNLFGKAKGGKVERPRYFKRRYQDGGSVRLYSPNPDAPTSYGGPDTEMPSRRPLDPVTMLWRSLPPEARAAYRSGAEYLMDFTPPAALRDALGASGRTSRAVINGDPLEAAISGSEVALNMLGALPGMAAVRRVR